ncbi:MAG: thermonuclease family protein [Deinococcales bacterium]
MFVFHTPVRIILLTTFLLLGFVAMGQNVPKENLQGPYRILDIIDGDTYTLERLGKVRLKGIDTPEKNEGDKLDRMAAEKGLPKHIIQAMGRGATDFAKSWLSGQRIWVEGSAQEDQYGRVLAFLYVEGSEGDWQYNRKTYYQVNLEIIRAGWAEPFRAVSDDGLDNPYRRLFETAMREAEAAQKGMWATAPERQEGEGIIIECVMYNPQGRDEGNEYVSLSALSNIDVTNWSLVDSEGHTIFLEGLLEEGYIYDFYATNDEAIWGNNGDTVKLFDDNGYLVDEFAYKGGSNEACR